MADNAGTWNDVDDAVDDTVEEILEGPDDSGFVAIGVVDLTDAAENGVVLPDEMTSQLSGSEVEELLRAIQELMQGGGGAPDFHAQLSRAAEAWDDETFDPKAFSQLGYMVLALLTDDELFDDPDRIVAESIRRDFGTKMAWRATFLRALFLGYGGQPESEDMENENSWVWQKIRAHNGGLTTTPLTTKARLPFED